MWHFKAAPVGVDLRTKKHDPRADFTRKFISTFQQHEIFISLSVYGVTVCIWGFYPEGKQSLV